MRLPEARVSRDTILFVGGLVGLTYETLTNGVEKPTLIIAFVGMLGLPLFIRSDELRRSNGTERKQPPKPPPLEIEEDKK